MESAAGNLYNQFQSLRAQVDGLNEGIEPRKLFSHLVVVLAICSRICEVEVLQYWMRGMVLLLASPLVLFEFILCCFQLRLCYGN